MARRKAATAEALPEGMGEQTETGYQPEAGNGYPETVPDRQPEFPPAVVQQGEHHPEPGSDVEPRGHAENVGRRQFVKAPDPFGADTISGDGNNVTLKKSMADRAWIIRFDRNPNEMKDADGVQYSKERPHPVLEFIKKAGYRWGFSEADGAGGWGKLMQEGHYTHAEHMDARKVLEKAGEMIGAKKEQALPPF